MRPLSINAARARSVWRRARPMRWWRPACSTRRAASRTSRSSCGLTSRRNSTPASDPMSTDATSARRSVRGTPSRRARTIRRGSPARPGIASICSRCRSAAMTSWPPPSTAAPCVARGHRACVAMSRLHCATRGTHVSTPGLTRRSAPTRPILMTKRVTTGAAELIPDQPTLNKVCAAAKSCRACDLWRHATQTVFGEGAAKAPVMFVGEQPGNEEDLSGHPFVGPAGKLLDKALEEAGIERSRAYVTNVVKHFKWEPRGKRRIHAKPDALEIMACRPWLEAELAVVKPEIVVCLGATAAQALLGKKFKVTQERGKIFASVLAPRVLATVHPSSILRAPDDETRHVEMRRFIDDLKKVADVLASPS